MREIRGNGKKKRKKEKERKEGRKKREGERKRGKKEGRKRKTDFPHLKKDKSLRMKGPNG